MKRDLSAHSNGVLLLGVHNLKNASGSSKPAMFCCTSADYTMGMNELPTLNLIVGQGEPISGEGATHRDSDGSLTMLIEQGVAKRWEDAKLLRCTLYEADNDGTRKSAIFKGYIISVTELVKTSGNSTRSVRVLCMGIGAMLHIAPIAGYRQTIGSIMVNGAQGQAELPTNGVAQTGFVDPFVYLEGETADNLVENYSKDLLGQDILTKAAYLSNAIVEHSRNEDVTSLDTLSQKIAESKDTGELHLDDNTLHIKSCLWCDYAVNTDVLHKTGAEKSFNRHLCNALIDNLQRSSVLASLVGVLSSMDFLMNVVPHFVYGGSADDFRMELIPSEAWNATDILTIPDMFVTGCNTVLNHMEHLNDPEVLVVDYSDGVGDTDGSQTSGQSTGLFGVFSLNKDVADWARLRYTSDRNVKWLEQAKRNMESNYYKTRFFRAPAWLDFAYLTDDVSAAVKKTPEDEPDNDNEAKGGYKTLTSQQQADFQRRAQIADLIAEAMFVFLHGASDVATFQLTSDIRFGLNDSIGCLENHIGKAVDIKGYRGILRQVRYTYTSGASTNSTYSIVLERVRLINRNEPHVKCQLYKKLNKNTGSSGMNSLWGDSSSGSASTFSAAHSAINNLLGSADTNFSATHSAVSGLLGSQSSFDRNAANVAQQIYSAFH